MLGEDEEAGFPGLREEEEDLRERKCLWFCVFVCFFQLEAVKREDTQNVGWGWGVNRKNSNIGKPMSLGQYIPHPVVVSSG